MKLERCVIERNLYGADCDTHPYKITMRVIGNSGAIDINVREDKVPAIVACVHDLLRDAMKEAADSLLDTIPLLESDKE
jgi:hypothetical protein